MSARTDAWAAALASRGLSLSSDLNAYDLKEIMRLADVIGGDITVEGGTAASYDTDPDQGANAAIVFTAAFEGALPSLAIQYVAGGTAGAEAVSLGIGADGQVIIKVTVETGVSTADQVKAALDAEDLSSLCTYADKAGNDGSGAVVTMAAKTFTGGVNPGIAFS